MYRYSKFIVLFFMLFFGVKVGGQTISSDAVSLGNFVKRMYESQPFEGCRILDDYDNKYLISLVVLDKTKYKDQITMDRVANVKARNNTSIFLNGSTISSEYIITTDSLKTDSASTITVKTSEIIKESSVGFVQGMEVLLTFETASGTRKVYVLYRKVD